MKFVDLIDIKQLQELWQSFSDAFNIGTAILDMDGNVLISTNWQPICTQFHRVNPKTAERCLESDTALANNLDKGGKYNVYRCKNGLVDVAVPIIIKGEHVANFYIGQVLFEKPDLSYFGQQSQAFGFDTQEYLNSLAMVPVVDESKVHNIMTYLVKQIELIAEHALIAKEHEESERRLLESQMLAKIGQWELDLRSNTLYWSNEVFNIFEIDRTQFAATYEAFVNTIHPGDREMVNSAYTHSLETKEPYDIVHRLKMSDGRIKYIRELCRTEFEGDTPILSIGAIQDITDLKQAEDGLKYINNNLQKEINSQLHKLREKDRQLFHQSKLAQMGDMISMIAHQWRQPLNAISGTGVNLSLLAIMSKLEVAKVQESGQFIQNQCQKMSSTIDTFINFVKPDNEAKLFKIFHSLEEIMTIIGAQLKNHNIEVNIKSIHEDISIKGYEDLLEQVIINILSNARDAFESIESTNNFINITIDTQEDYSVLSTRSKKSRLSSSAIPIIIIEDNAGGIPEDIREKIFNPYFTTKEQGKGTGIGLYMSMRIMKESFDGDLIYSDTGNGSRFTIVCGGK